MSRTSRAAAWVIGVVVAGLVAASIGYWLFGPPTAYFCGEPAYAQMRTAVNELDGVIPAAAVIVTDDCDSGGEVYAVWEIEDIDKMVADARAFGCRVDDRGFTDDDHPFLRCDTTVMEVIYYLDPWVKGGSPASGGMERA